MKLHSSRRKPSSLQELINKNSTRFGGMFFHFGLGSFARFLLAEDTYAKIYFLKGHDLIFFQTKWKRHENTVFELQRATEVSDQRGNT